MTLRNLGPDSENLPTYSLFTYDAKTGMAKVLYFILVGALFPAEWFEQ